MDITIALLLAWATSTTLQGNVPTPIRVEGLGWEGAIISGEAQLSSDPRHVLKLSQVWTPTEADVREAERLLPEYLDSRDAALALRGSRIRAELERYKRQYWGVIRGGQRDILIHFYHVDTDVGRKQLWLRGMLAVAGGGDHFFRITYQMQRKRFAMLQINAPE